MASDMDLIKTFLNNLNQTGPIQPNDKVLIAVSGGVDSVVLLDLFKRIQSEYHLELKVVHLNHGLRGAEADADEAFVKALSASYGFPLLLKKVDTKGFVAKSKMSIEQGARVLRYQFFDETLKQTGFQWLAMAHNANDQAETILDHLLRGSGVKGLSGMPSRRGPYIRPLLTVTRKEIETYASERSLKYRTDSTNVDIRFRRNRIRHQLIPYLQEHFNPAVVEVLTRTGTALQENETYLEAQARAALNRILKICKKNKIILDIDPFLNYFSIVQKYVLFQIVETLSIGRESLTFQQLDRILNLIRNKRIGNRVLLKDDWQVTVSANELIFYRPCKKHFSVKIDVGKTYPLFDGELIFSAEVIDRSKVPVGYGGSSRIEYIDYDRVVGQLRLRNFRRGDKFQPLNMEGEKKVSDFFIDEKVPSHERREIPILECQQGIVWVCGYRIDDRYKITPGTNKVLRLQIKEAEDGN